MRDFSMFILLPDWKPPIFHGKTVRSNISQSLWRKKIRQTLLESHNFTCCICNHNELKENSRKLHAHEVEEYDLDKLVCCLQDIQLLCAKCHAFSHFQLTLARATPEQIIDLENHFIQVNNCEREDLRKYLCLKRERENEITKELYARLGLQNVIRRVNYKVTYKVNECVPFYNEIVFQLKNKGLLYEV
ncbi:hypothetical protein QCI42_29480 [Bacillus fungorum]|uniref:hypothetical protein n=1 Tax=Bacillus fungorum TaxID=2039284 RepID=UPI0033986DF9